MKADKPIISLQEPQLPEGLANARRNHGGMTVPDDFFQQFERKMNAVIDADVAARKAEQEAAASAQPVLRPALTGWQRYLTVAAAVVIAVALGIFISKQGVVDTPDTSLVPLTAGTTAAEQPVIEEVTEPVTEELMASASDYDIFEYLCDI